MENKANSSLPYILSIIFWVLVGLSVVLLQGCGTIFTNPNGKVSAEYNPATGIIKYESTKSVNVEIVKDGEKITLRIESDAASGIKARSEAAKVEAENLGSIIKLIPVK